MLKRYLIKDILLSAEIEDNFLQIKLENTILYEYNNEKNSAAEVTIKKLALEGVLHCVRAVIHGNKNTSWEELITTCKDRIYCNKLP